MNFSIGALDVYLYASVLVMSLDDFVGVVTVICGVLQII